MYGIYRSFNNDKIKQAKDKLLYGELILEDVLKDNDLVNSFKLSTLCHLIDLLTIENIQKLVYYIISYPFISEYDDENRTKRFPFNASEILSSENKKIINRIFQKEQVEDEKISKNNTKKEVDRIDDDEIMIKKYFKEEISEVPINKEDTECDNENNQNSNIISINENDIQIKINKKDDDLNNINDRQTDFDADANANKNTFQISKNESDNENEMANANENSNANINIDDDKNENSKETNPHEEKDEKVEKYPILDLFFSFLNSDNDLDHVLSGYFAKVFCNLNKNNEINLIKYLFERPNIIYQMIRHSNRISITECLIKIITCNTDLILLNNSSCDEIKEEVFKQLFEVIENKILIFKSEDECDYEIIDSICSFFKDCIDHQATVDFFIKCPKFSLKLFETFLHPVFSNNMQILITYLEKVFLELTNSKEVDGNHKDISPLLSSSLGLGSSSLKDECYYFLELFNSMLDYLFMKFRDEGYGLSTDQLKRDFLNTCLDIQKRLGIGKIYIVNLVIQILKHLFYVYENRLFHYEYEFYYEFYNKLTTNDFFSIAIRYFLEFPLNNIYQNSFTEMILEILKHPSINSSLYEHIFYEIGFLEEMILCVVDNRYSSLSMFYFPNSNISIQSGFLPFIIEIVFLVRIASFQSEVIKEIILKTNGFEFFYSYFVEPSKIKFLSGLIMENNNKISFSDAERNSLRLCDFSVYEKLKCNVSQE